MKFLGLFAWFVLKGLPVVSRLNMINQFEFSNIPFDSLSMPESNRPQSSF